MAAVLNLKMDSVARLELYEDDSLEVWFTDATRISMTACGNSFSRDEKAQNQPDPFGHLHAKKTFEVHQFTAYTTRDYRDKIRTLLTFRNTFAAQPFLPATLFTQQEILVLEHVKEYGAWPSSLHQAVHENLLVTCADGDVRLMTSNGYAWAELAGHGQTMTTCYLARISREDGITSDTNSSEEKVSGAKTLKNHNNYVWRRQVHSVAKPPPDWEHPLSLLLQYRSRDSHMTISSLDKENEGEDGVVSTSLPPTLPLSCPNLHLHLKQNQLCQRIKVLFTEGILYRVFIEGSPHSFVEALPNRNTVLRSHDPEGRFFLCWSLDKESGCGLQTSMYCIDHTPCSVGLHPFSVARVINQASRLLSQVKKSEPSKSTPCCWKASPICDNIALIKGFPSQPISTSPPPPPRLSSECSYTVPGFYQRTIYDQQSQREVLAELSKIERFNTITSRKVPETSHREASGCGQLIDRCGQLQMPSFVQDTLKQTQLIVKDIDSLLAN